MCRHSPPLSLFLTVSLAPSSALRHSSSSHHQHDSTAMMHTASSSNNSTTQEQTAAMQEWRKDAARCIRSGGTFPSLHFTHLSHSETFSDASIPPPSLVSSSSSPLLLPVTTEVVTQVCNLVHQVSDTRDDTLTQRQREE